jgi:hypothetical protein
MFLVLEDLVGCESRLGQDPQQGALDLWALGTVLGFRPADRTRPVGDESVPSADQDHRISGLSFRNRGRRLWEGSPGQDGVAPSPGNVGVASVDGTLALALGGGHAFVLSREGVRHYEMVRVFFRQSFDLFLSQYVFARVVDKEEVDLGAFGFAFQRDPGDLQEGCDSSPTGYEADVPPAPAHHHRRAVHHPLALELGLYRRTDLHIAEVLADAPALFVGIGLDDQVEVAVLIGVTHGGVRLGQGPVALHGGLVVDFDAGGEERIGSQKRASLREAVPEPKGIVGQFLLEQKFEGLFRLVRYRRCCSLGRHHSALHAAAAAVWTEQAGCCGTQKCRYKDDKQEGAFGNRNNSMVVASLSIVRYISCRLDCCH